MKHLLMFALLIGILSLTTNVSAQLPGLEDAVSIWLFDEGSGSTAINGVTGGPDGTVNGGATWVEGVGGVGQALFFDGVDDYVIINANPLTDQRAVTIQMYIKNLNSGDEKKFFNLAADEDYKFLWEVKTKFTPPGTWAPSLYLKWEGTKLFEQIPDADTPHLCDNDEQWHHVATVVEPINANEVTFTQYVDHDLTHSVTANFNGFINTCLIVIGSRFCLTKGWFSGHIDNVVLHDKVLTPEEFLPTPEDIASSVDNTVDIPTAFALEQNYPNPFNPATTIQYRIPQADRVMLKIYDLLGREVRTLVIGVQQTGSHKVIWDGRNEMGQPVADGIYLYRLSSGDFVRMRKMTLLK